MNKIFTSIILCFFCISELKSQNFIQAYTDQTPGSYCGVYTRIATDLFNNVVNATTFNGDISCNGQVYNSNGSLGTLIVKKDNNGNIIWAKSLTCGNTAVLGGIYIDDQSNIYVTGMFGNPNAASTLNCIPFPISAGPGMYAYIIKYAPDGTVLWSNSLKATPSGAIGNFDLFRIAGNGNKIVISSPFIQVGSQNVGSSTINSTDGSVFLAEIDQNGAWQNAKVLTDTTNSYISLSLAMNNNGELFVSGLFKGTLDLGSAGTLVTPGSEARDFVFKVNSSGNYEWAQILGTSSWWRPKVLTYQNDIYMIGGFGSSFTLGGTTLNTNVNTTYLTKIDNSGNFLWAKKLGESETQFYDACIGNNRIYLSGYTSPYVTNNTFDGLNLQYSSSLPLSQQLSTICFLLVTDLNGTPQNGAFYSFSFATLNTQDMACSSHKVFLSGNVGSQANFGGYSLTAPQTNGANYVAIYTDSANIISGSSFYDMNANNLFDTSEIGCPVIYTLTHGGVQTSTLVNGNYLIGVGTGSYISNIPYIPLYYTLSNNSYTSNFGTQYNQIDSNLKFAFQPIPNQSDLVIDLTTGFFRPGFTGVAFVTLKNIGTTSEGGTIQLSLSNSSVTVVSTSPVATSMSGNQASLDYNLNPAEQISWMINYQTDPAAQLGSPVICQVTAMNVNDLTPANNTDTLTRLVTGSYDPNMKEVFPAGEIHPDFITNHRKLDYVVHFQNTGTDTAFTVIIIDTLSNFLAPSTFEIISSSKPLTVNMYGNVVWFRLNHINLPDSNTNEPLSHGFVKYRIQPKSACTIGDEIENKAFIYFDYNTPIVTNTTNTPIVMTVGIENSLKDESLRIFPNPTVYDYLKIEADSPIQLVEIYDINGKKIVMITGNKANNMQINTLALSNGNYVCKVITKNKTHIKKFVKN